MGWCWKDGDFIALGYPTGLNFVLGSNMLSQHILERLKLQADDSALNIVCGSGWLLSEGTTVPLKR